MVAKATLLQHPEDAGGLQVRMGTAWWAEEGPRAMVGGEVKPVGVEQGGREGFWKEDNGPPQTHAFTQPFLCKSFIHSPAHSAPLAPVVCFWLFCSLQARWTQDCPVPSTGV